VVREVDSADRRVQRDRRATGDDGVSWLLELKRQRYSSREVVTGPLHTLGTKAAKPSCPNLMTPNRYLYNTSLRIRSDLMSIRDPI
jgi:hypothetical protein